MEVWLKRKIERMKGLIFIMVFELLVVVLITNYDSPLYAAWLESIRPGHVFLFVWANWIVIQTLQIELWLKKCSGPDKHWGG